MTSLSADSIAELFSGAVTLAKSGGKISPGAWPPTKSATCTCCSPSRAPACSTPRLPAS